MAVKLVWVVVMLNLAIVTVQSQTCTSPTQNCDCFVDDDGLKVINCRYKSLQQVPVFTQSSETYDKIIFTSTEPTGQCVANCNSITSLQADAFANLNVKLIDLRNNVITSYHQNAFRGLETILNGLLIEGDGQISPPYGKISGLQNLRSLHLEHFRQTDMTTSNTNLTFPQLTTLTLKKLLGVNNIARQVFSSIPNVENLNLEFMTVMTRLPVAAILELQNLQSINILETKISRVYGDSFSSLSALHSIHFNGNSDLVKIDTTAFNGVEDTLEFLYLNQNSLTSSVLNIFASLSWGALTHLHLGYNTFASIPNGAFRTMPNLAYLEIQDAGLTDIDNTMFTGLAKLHTLDLAYNSIESISSGTFQNSPVLKELRLNHQETSNRQILFAANAFQGIDNSLERLFIERNTLDINQFWTNIGTFTNLLELNMAELGISSIPDRAFENNVRLSNLDMSGNSITTLNQETFYGPRNTLKVINLQSNQIQTVSKCVFSDFANKPKVRLVSNALVCDCQIIWLFDWVMNQSSIHTASFNVGPCSSPTALQNKYFYEFQRSDLTCPPNYVEPTCPDLYLTTSTTTPSTTTGSTTTQPPQVQITLSTGPKTRTQVTVTWTVSDPTDVTRYLLRKTSSNGQADDTYVDGSKSSHTFDQLTAGQQYTFCIKVELNNVLQNYEKCKQVTTPDPNFELFIGPKTISSITVTWSVDDKTDITGYRLEMSPNAGSKVIETAHKDATQFTFPNLTPGSSYYFCLILELNDIIDNSKVSCKTGVLEETDGSTTPVTTEKPEAQTQVGIIVGVSVGAVILIVLLLVIVCLLLKSQKKKKRAPATEGVRFTSHAAVPQAGGTAKRFAKKAEADGTNPEDINVTVISSGDMNKDRMSAGSYQFLNEKNPRGVSQYPNGHYSNDFEARPLPREPGGANGHGRPSGSGYVNEAFKNSANHLPETSTNSYSEVRY